MGKENPQSVENDDVRWYAWSAADSAAQLEVDPREGLDGAEAERRLKLYGPNQLTAGKRDSALLAFLKQFRPLMQLVLLGAAVVAAIIGNWSTFALLIVVTVFNALLGLTQEAKAQRSIEALQEMMVAEARVRRDGEVIPVPAAELVPGDIVLIREGDMVPADGRLLTVASMQVEESSLTGESDTVSKSVEGLSETDVPVGDRVNMVFMQSSVTRGRGEMMVTATGMSTEVGHIADSLREKRKQITPLTRRITQLTRVILYLAAATLITILVVGSIRGKPFNALFGMGVALIIGAIPAGLPAVVTTILSIGTVALAKMNAIVKSLPSAETLGSTSAICSDKTGTLTMNQMTVRELVLPGARYKVTGQGYSTEGAVQRIAGDEPGSLDPVLLPMVLCSDATIKEGRCVGDPNEGALVVLAEKERVDVEATRAHFPRVATLPFDSEYKLMATFHDMEDESGRSVIRCFVKGAADRLLDLSSRVRRFNGEVLELDEEWRKGIEGVMESLARQGLRELMVARRDLDPGDFDPGTDLLDYVRELTLLALTGISDPPRAEAGVAISECHEAGIRVRMITGDHAITAKAVADELGIEGDAVAGSWFEKLGDEEAERFVDDIGVVARVAPRDKVKMVEILQSRGEVVAMTGDGVNDAPALRAADIGVAMGVSGTDVSKEAAAMILTDDNFSTIVRAVKEGRVIYDNLMKFIRLQMSNLVAFILGFLGAGAIASVALFTPFQILWIKFGSLVPVGAVLGYDTPAPDVMKREPRPSDQPVIDLRGGIQIFLMGLMLAAASVAMRQWALHHYGSGAVAQTMAFAVFAHGPVLFALNMRFPDVTIFSRKTLTNAKLWYSFLWCVAGVVLITQLKLLRNVFDTVQMSVEQWGICLAMVAVLILLGDLIKLPLRLVPRKN
ncbi:MAG: cation-transporting P-type ATPase [Actinomycetota bacterium]|nr:cation-transporting P-type ATPase [Actinomycetota bacterium]